MDFCLFNFHLSRFRLHLHSTITSTSTTTTSLSLLLFSIFLSLSPSLCLYLSSSLQRPTIVPPSSPLRLVASHISFAAVFAATP